MSHRTVTGLTVPLVCRIYDIRMAAATSSPRLSLPVRPVVCILPKELQTRLDRLATSKVYPANTVLFEQGQAVDRVFIVRKGNVHLSMRSDHGQQSAHGVARRGEILGLSACIACTCYGSTAKATESVEVSVVERDRLLELLGEGQLACQQVVSLLCDGPHIARQVRWLASLDDPEEISPRR